MNPTALFSSYITIKGGPQKAAEALGITDGMVSHIVTGKRGISPRIANLIHADTNGLIPREKLRPDVFKVPGPDLESKAA